MCSCSCCSCSFCRVGVVGCVGVLVVLVLVLVCGLVIVCVFAFLGGVACVVISGLDRGIILLLALARVLVRVRVCLIVCMF